MPQGYIPKRPVGDTAEARFMQAVWDAVWGGDFPFINTPQVQWTTGQKGYIANVQSGTSGPGGTLVYIKACLDDGSEAFIPLRIYGKIYALAGGTGYVTPTIDPGDVPDGAKLLQ